MKMQMISKIKEMRKRKHFNWNSPNPFFSYLICRLMKNTSTLQENIILTTNFSDKKLLVTIVTNLDTDVYIYIVLSSSL